MIEPFAQTLSYLYQILSAIPHLFSHSDELSGIIGIVLQGGQFVGMDILKALNFSILLSLNLAVLNMLPIPVLDGGKIVLYLLETVHQKFLRLHVPLAIAGWIFIIGLMMYATVLDIGRYFMAVLA